MGRDKYRNDDRRRRAKRDDDDRDPYHRPRRPRSGAVTSVAVLNLVVGPLTLLFSMCGALATTLPALEAPFLGLPGGLAENTVVTLMVMGLVFFWGLTAIVTGIGLLCRAGWSRMLGLLLGGCALPAGLLYFAVAVLFLAGTSDSTPEDRAGSFLTSLARCAFFLGYSAWMYGVLLHPRRVAEFR